MALRVALQKGLTILFDNNSHVARSRLTSGYQAFIQRWMLASPSTLTGPIADIPAHQANGRHIAHSDQNEPLFFCAASPSKSR
jgi:hypothetical protein